jgi:serine/threonine protein kinase
VVNEQLEPSDWATERAGMDLRPHRVVEGEAEWTRGYARDEHVARTVRLRKIMLWGALAWLSFLPTDLTFNAMRGEAFGWTFVFARLLTTAPLMMLWWRLGRAPSYGPTALAVAEAAVISIIAGTTAYMAVLSDGLASPIVAGLLPILVVRALAIPEPWQRGIPVVSAPLLVFWGVLALGTWLSPGLQAPEDPVDPIIANVILQLGMQFVTIAMIVAGSHIAWDVRRNLYRARVVARYELLRPLGRGAMGEVWVAWHQSLRQQVALKILPVHEDAQAVARFEREVAATTKLRHPNTVRVYDFGHTHDGFWFYAMELLEGETLTELVVREGPLPVTRALSLLRQSTRALAEAHGLGIVHRDIKPDNLFVSAPAGERDVIKVLDFGVASVAVVLAQGPTEPLSLHGDEEHPTEPGHARVSSGADLSEHGRVVGTPLYISPEVARGGKAGPRSDIYALGCVLYFMLTSRPVFVERDVASLLRAHAEKLPASPSTLLAESLPEYVEKLILRCLAKDPEQRYENADALVAAIDLCLRLGDIDRRRGGGESQLPRTRAGLTEVEAWVKHARTETDMSLIGSDGD